MYKKTFHVVMTEEQQVHMYVPTEDLAEAGPWACVNAC